MIPSMPLSDACEFVLDGTHGSPERVESGIPVLSAQNVLNGELNYNSDRFTTEAEYHAFRKRLQISNGDVLLTIVGTIGRSAVVTRHFPAVFQRSVAVLRPKNQLLHDRYLFHVTQSHQFKAQLTRATNQSSQAGVYLGKLNKALIPVPPLAEQRRVAAILDQAEALRAKRRAAVAQLETLTQALFLDVFGDPITNPMRWTRVPFGELLTRIDSGWSPICLDRPVADDEWGVLKLGAVTWCEYNPAENKALPPNVTPEPELEVKSGDLLFTRKNTHDLVAACALVRSTPPRLMMSDLIFRFRLRPEANLDACFLHRLLIYPTKRREIQKLAGGSAGSMPNISKTRLEAASIEVPPLSLQHEFARRVEAVEKLKTTHRASLVDMDTLFAALQHRAFRGQL